MGYLLRFVEIVVCKGLYPVITTTLSPSSPLKEWSRPAAETGLTSGCAVILFVMFDFFFSLTALSRTKHGARNYPSQQP